jgi:hypothetical protein
MYARSKGLRNSVSSSLRTCRSRTPSFSKCQIACHLDGRTAGLRFWATHSSCQVSTPSCIGLQQFQHVHCHKACLSTPCTHISRARERARALAEKLLHDGLAGSASAWITAGAGGPGKRWGKPGARRAVQVVGRVELDDAHHAAAVAVHVDVVGLAHLAEVVLRRARPHALACAPRGETQPRTRIGRFGGLEGCKAPAWPGLAEHAAAR